MYWPTPQDYNEVVQWPDSSFEDEELRLGKPELNALGLPKPVCGNFASVYKFKSARRAVAVKCFLRNVFNQHQRYAHLTSFMAVNHVQSIIDFQYLLKGVFVNEDWYPLVKMGWVEGMTLDHFLRKNMYDRAQMDRFLTQFTEVVKELQRHGIAHGDLQHGNVIVTANNIMLVDYDGIFVPDMAGEESNELGHPNYQHPGRTSEHFNPDLDHFSAWIIYHTVQFLRLDPTLWQRHSGGDDCLLFRRSDFENPSQSRLISELEKHPVPDIRARVQVVKALLRCGYDEVPRYDPNLTATKKPPEAPHVAPVQTSEIEKVEWWPTAAAYTGAMQYPALNLNDPFLQQGRPIKDERIVGKRGVIFKISCLDKSYAVKCFLNPASDRRARFEAISKHQMGDAGKYLVSFQYQSKGIKVEDHWFPILKMSWVDGTTVEQHVRRLLKTSNKSELLRLLGAFGDMMGALAASGIAHGDLEPSNIMVDSKDRLKLVDYDTMYVPALAHLQCAETVETTYQHPSRTIAHYGPYIDNYPALLIDSILSCMAMLPPENLWNWNAFLQQMRPTNTWKSSPNQASDAVARIGRLIREMRKYRIDQVPTLNASRSL